MPAFTQEALFLNTLDANGVSRFKGIRPQPDARMISFLDGVNGDDALAGDGTVTPYKTLRAALTSTPLRTACASTSWTNPAVLAYALRIAAGTYNITFDMTKPYNFQLPYGMTLQGEYTTLQTFTLDHYSGDGMHLWQPAGNTGWTVNEWAGKFVELPASSGTTAPGRYPILSNGTHDLVVGWSPTSAAGGRWYDYTPSVGASIKIVQHATIFTGSLSLVGCPYVTFRDIEFKCLAVNGTVVYPQYFTNASFVNCKFTGVGTWSTMVYPRNANIFFSHCLFDNVYGGVGTIDNYPSTVIFSDVSALNTNRIIEIRSDSLVANSGPIHSYNSADLFFGMRNGKVFESGGDYHCDSNGGSGTVIFQLINTNFEFKTTNGLVGSIIDGKSPLVVVRAGRGGKVTMSKVFMDLVDPCVTILATTDANVDVPITMDDLVNLYGGYYNVGDGIEIQAIGG